MRENCLTGNPMNLLCVSTDDEVTMAKEGREKKKTSLEMMRRKMPSSRSSDQKEWPAGDRRPYIRQ